MITRPSFRAFFWKFLISYISVLGVPLVLMLILYSASASVVERDAIESRAALLYRIRDMVDKHLAEIDELTYQITYDSKLIALMRSDPPGPGKGEVFPFWDYMRTLEGRTTTLNDFKGSFYIILPKPDVVFSSDGTYLDIEPFYGKALSFEGLDYALWSELFLSRKWQRETMPARRAVVGGSPKSAIAVLSSIPAIGSGPPEGVIAFLIDEGELARLFKDIAYQGAGRVNVSGPDGRTYADVRLDSKGPATGRIEQRVERRSARPNGPSKERIDGTETLVIAATGKAGWRYEAFIPTNALSASLAPIRNAAIIYAALALVVGLALSAAFASRNSAPIAAASQAVQEFLGRPGREDPSPEALPGGVRKIIADARAMEGELERRDAAFRAVAVERLLNGEYQDDARSRAFLDHLGIAASGSTFVAIVAIVGGSGAEGALPASEELRDLANARADVETAVVAGLPDILVHPVNEHEIAFIASFPAGEGEVALARAADILARIAAALPEPLRARTRFGLGSARDKALAIHHSFREARRAARFRSAADIGSGGAEGQAPPVVRYDETGVAAAGAFYPFETEARLVNTVKAGDREGTMGLLDSLRDANFSVRLPDGQAELLVADMRSTFGKLLSDAPRGASESFPGWGAGTGEPEDDFQALRGRFLALCDAYGEERARKPERTAERVVAWTEARYADPSLSVPLAAEAFQLSESRFAQVFKEATGRTYAAFLEATRIGKAREIMASERAKVDDIARRVGYSNASSFRRAFKRVTGVPPSDYS